MRLLLGTNNKGKIVEMTEVFGGMPLTIVTPFDLGIAGDIDETGTTFQQNALLKARHFYVKSKIPTIADDSGIIVSALEKELGVQTRRWGAGALATDEEWIAYFLERMKHEKNREATFMCCLAYIDEMGCEHVFEGRCDGVITETLEADYLPGLPISACFKPHGYSAVYSAMNIEQKNSTSHRGKALQKLKKHLEKH